jgi:DNA-binding NarL/FixJ family response regulator
VKLLIVEDHRIIVMGCRALFADHARIEILEAATVAAARSILAKASANIAIIDTDLPDGSGLEFVRAMRSEHPSVRVIVLSPDSTPVQAMQAIEAGAMAFVSKAADPAELRDAVLAVEKGERWLPADLVQQMALMRSPGKSPASALSDREVSVLRELVRGRSMAEIAGALSVSYKTVTNDCAALRTKLNARTNPQLVRVALDLKIA